MAELAAAVSSGDLGTGQGSSLMDRVTGAGRQVAVDAIGAAVARGGNGAKIAEAEQALADGDALRAGGAYKAAVNVYKDAVDKAEGA